MSATSVGRRLLGAPISLSTRGSTLERSPLPVVTVAKPLLRVPTLSCISEAILVRGRMSAKSVGKPSAAFHTSSCTRESTLQRSRTTAASVGRPSVSCLALLFTRGFTVETFRMCVMNVGKRLRVAHTCLFTRESIMGRNLTHVTSVARPSDRGQASPCTSGPTPGRSPMSVQSAARLSFPTHTSCGTTEHILQTSEKKTPLSALLFHVWCFCAVLFFLVK